MVRKHMRKPSRHKRSPIADCQRSRQNKPIPAGKRLPRNNRHTGHRHTGEQKRRHTTQHRRRNRHQRRSKLGKYTHDDQEEAAEVAGFAVGAAGERDDAVVLGEGGHGCDGHEGGEESVQAVG